MALTIKAMLSHRDTKRTTSYQTKRPLRWTTPAEGHSNQVGDPVYLTLEDENFSGQLARSGSSLWGCVHLLACRTHCFHGLFNGE